MKIWSGLVFLLLLVFVGSFGIAKATPGDEIEAQEAPSRGLLVHEKGMSPGYTLISPFAQKKSYLLDEDGLVVHMWESRYKPGLAPYLLPNGNLLRGIQIELESQFGAGGISGGIQEFSWDGDLLWEFHLASDLYYHHHDIEPLASGNFLMLAWESKSKQEVLDAGRRPTHVGEKGLWSEVVLEIEPLRPIGARVVWEWRVWDHLIQDTDPSLPNFGVVKDHPERVDINGDIPEEEPEQEEEKEDSISDAERAQLIALGYLDPSDDDGGKSDSGGDEDKKKTKEDEEKEKKERQRTDWLHMNGVDYNPDLDQIVVSSWQMSEIWIIDHSTSTEEARQKIGGRSGQGGDLLYRWGNPQIYGRGTSKDRELFHQHDPQWVPKGFPGEGNITIFNNGRKRSKDDEYSTVMEITPPLEADGTYACGKDVPYGPESLAWEYGQEKEDRFFASFISGTQRLANGNTLACSGPQGRLMEISPQGEVIWDYHNPFAIFRDDKRPSGGPDDFTYGMFRGTRIPPDALAFRGRDLTPLDPQPKTAEELFAEKGEQEAPTGWQDLLSKEIVFARWENATCEKWATFRLEEDQSLDAEGFLLSTGSPVGFLRSDRMYENFMFEFEWRHMEDEGEAGLLIFADPLPATGEDLARGIRIEMSSRGDSDTYSSHGDVQPILGATMTPDPRFRISGSSSLPKVDSFHTKLAKEWNHYRVTAIDGSVTLEVNGKIVSGATHCNPKKGYLGLASGNGEVQYKNLRIWELPTGSNAADGENTADVHVSSFLLFKRKDLEGWKTLSGEWTVNEGGLLSGSDRAEIEKDLAAEAVSITFDFKRERSLGSGSKLPFKIGGVRFRDPGSNPMEWHRVSIELKESTIEVSFQGEKLVLPRKEESSSTLSSTFSLMNDGVATEFVNVFYGVEQ